MKTVMIIDKELNVVEKIKTILKENNTNVINVESSRQAIEELNKENNVNLILINTNLTDKNTNSYLSMKPDSNLSTTIDDANNLLQKPFTDEQFKRFLRDKL
jgi:two-component SAPR family response regulator